MQDIAMQNISLSQLASVVGGARTSPRSTSEQIVRPIIGISDSIKDLGQRRRR